MNKKNCTVLNINGHPVRVYVKCTLRRTIRFSFTKAGLNVLLPLGLSADQIREHVAKAVRWLETLARKKPGLITRYEDKARADLLRPRPDVVVAMDTTIHIRLSTSQRQTFTGRWHNDEILISARADVDAATINQQRTKLVSRLLVARFGQQFDQRVHQLNKIFFNKPIARIRYRYNRRVWGSCSSKNTLSFSTRAFLLPAATRDYLIIHELAHLVHRNHSDAFWQEVARCMPEYKTYDRLLSSAEADVFDF